jgi:hypothetical protein
MSKPVNEFNKWFEHWMEGIGRIAEFRLVKSSVSAPIKPDIASFMENAAYTNGYSSGYAFRTIQDVDGKIVFTNEAGRIVAYYPKVSTLLLSRSISKHTNTVDSAFIQGWLLGESDVAKNSAQHNSVP